jgi:hypothetical protein
MGALKFRSCFTLYASIATQTSVAAKNNKTSASAYRGHFKSGFLSVILPSYAPFFSLQPISPIHACYSCSPPMATVKGFAYENN